MKKEFGIRAHYDPKGGEKKDLQYVYERKQQMEEGREKVSKKWPDWEKQYDGFRKEKDADDWRSNLVVPTTAAIVEAQLSEIIDQNMRPRVMPRGLEDKPKAVVMNAIIDYTWEVGRADIELYKIIKDALIFGTGIGQEYYRKETREVSMFKEINKKGKEIYEDQEFTDFDDVYLESIKLDDFLVDEKARSFSGSYPARDAIRRYVMRMDDFKNFFKGPVWDPLGHAKYVKAGGDTSYYEYFKPPEASDRKDLVEVLWYWSTGPTPGEQNRHDNLIIVANDVVVKRGPSPYNHKRLPFVSVVDILKPHHFYGKGESELLESIQEEQTTIRRMIVDRNHLDIDKSFLVSNRESEFNDEDLVSQPHQAIFVDDINNIKPLEYGDIPKSVFASLEQIKEDAVRVTGHDDRMQSVKTPGTATEAAILKEATLKRLRSKLWLLRNLGLYQIGVLRESNIRQFYTVPKVEKIVGEKSGADYRRRVRDAYRLGRLKMVNGEPHREKFRNIRLSDKKLEVGEDKISIKNSREPFFFEASPELIVPYYGSFDVKIEPTPSFPVSKPLEQERISMMYDRLVQNPGFDPVKLGEALLEKHDYDPDEFTPEKAAGEKFESSLVQRSIEVASVENDEMLNGRSLPPTPMAQEPHTEVHIAMIESPQVMDLPSDSPILTNIVTHIVGELQAQQQRAGAGIASAGGTENTGGLTQSQYKPPSGPTAVKQTGQTALPAIAEREQNANELGSFAQ